MKKEERSRAFGDGAFAALLTDVARENDAGWRKVTADNFDDLANLLERGLSRMDAVIVCRAAAEAIRDPENSEEIKMKAEIIMNTARVTKP